jgi:hypothetical protein
MVDFKELLKEAKSALTSPTAFSWYGVAGVVATGILTFISTKKWIELRSDTTDEYWDEAENKVIGEGNAPTNSFDEVIDIVDAYKEELKNRPFKEKATEAIKTALIFTPTFAAAVGASYCILHGNYKAMGGIRQLVDVNANLSSRLDQCKPFAAGMLASKFVPSEKPVCPNPHKLYFCDDDLQHEDYGELVYFFIERPDGEVIDFASTPLEVLMAEYEFNKLIWSDRVGEFGSLNELLSLYNARNVDDGDYCGWSKYAGFKNGYTWVGFSHKKVDLKNGERGYFIIFDSEPTYDELFERMIHG